MLKAIAEKKAEGQAEQKEAKAASKEKNAPAEQKKKAAPEKVKAEKPAEQKEAEQAEPQKSEEDKLREAVAATLYAINCSVSAEDMIDLITCSKFAYGSYRGGMSHMVRDYIEKTKATIKNYEIFRANEAERFYEHRMNKLKDKQAKTGKDD